MKYIETQINHLALYHADVHIADAPDNGNNSCLKIADDYFMPFIGWMKYDPSNDGWTEITQDEEDTIVTKLSESCAFRELSTKEAGEMFSDDVEFIE